VTLPKRFGLSAAMTTPFGPDGSIDLRRFAEHGRWCLDHGCSSITVFGTTGEGASIGMRTREQVLETLAAANIRDIVYCVAASAVEDAAAQARMGLEAGCLGLLLTPPFYFKGVSDDGLFDWFSRVIEASGHRAAGVILYNIPSVTQVALSIELVGRLKEVFPGVVTAVKDSSGDWGYTQKLLAAHGDLAILIGDERFLAEGVQRGGQGAISGLANIIPQALLELAVHGKADERVNRLVDEVLRYPVVPAVKVLLAHRANDKAWEVVRAPLRGLSPAETGKLRASFDQLFTS
jgi:4-hydroxy-tetrahydrodipicolinate synthase